MAKALGYRGAHNAGWFAAAHAANGDKELAKEYLHDVRSRTDCTKLISYVWTGWKQFRALPASKAAAIESLELRKSGLEYVETY